MRPPSHTHTHKNHTRLPHPAVHCLSSGSTSLHYASSSAILFPFNISCYIESAALCAALLRFVMALCGMYSTSYSMYLIHKTYIAWASNVLPWHRSTSLCCSNVTIMLRDVKEYLIYKLDLYPTKALCLSLSYSVIPIGWGSGHTDPITSGEIKQGVSQWHSEFDNLTIDALSIIALSLEKSAWKEIPPVTLSRVFLFILTFKSIFLWPSCCLNSIALLHAPSR